MPPLQTMSSVLGLAFASGVNLYAAVLVLGLGIRYGWISGLPGELHALANPVILVVAGLMYLLEFFADKIPFVSVAWDTIHTIIRPLGGAVLALASVSNMDPAFQVIAFLAGGSVALGAHSTKMGYRLLGHASPEPVSASILSLAEDFGVIGLVLLVYKHPIVALCLVIALLFALGFLAPMLFRTIVFLFTGLVDRVKSLSGADSTARDAPSWLSHALADVSGGAWRLQRCFARSFPGVPRLKAGYLASSGAQGLFATRTFTGEKLLPLQGIERQRGLIFDILSGRAGDRPVAVYATKHCPLVKFDRTHGETHRLKANAS